MKIRKGCFVLLLVVPFVALSQSSLISQPLTPLEHLLNPDGTVNSTTGFSGRLDPKGWRMRTELDGTPRFVREENAMLVDPADTLWDSRFFTPGMNNYVYALAVMGTDLYVGGGFTVAGGVGANRIAKWNGSSWSALGTGMNGDVQVLAVFGTDLYAGGYFTTAGGVSANRIAKWDGSSWSALGSGMSGGSPYIPGVWALAFIGTDLYAGGTFTYAGGLSANRIAKWNGSSWSAVGSGANNIVLALDVMGTDLYAGGYFTSAGGVGTSRVAKWNGSNWSALGVGVNGNVWGMAVKGTDLYVGGEFTTAGGVSANRIAKWNGSSWDSLGAGVAGGSPFVYDLFVLGQDLYAGGEFTTAGGLSAPLVAKWDGLNWSSLGSGIGGSGVVRLAAMGTDLCASGEFITAGGIYAANIAKWNGTSWSGVDSGAGLDSTTNALAAIGPGLFAGGIFTTTGDVIADKISRWDGSNWSSLASGMDTSVYALAVMGTDLYVGGVFTTAGGVSANKIAKWNGSSWSSLASGMDTSVYALAVIGTDLYVGGAFTLAGGTSMNYIAKWDGLSWSSLGSGMNDVVRALVVMGADLYAGGRFTTAGGVSVNGIAKWNGSSWSSLGSGVDGIVNALAALGTDLYVGGIFTTAGGVSANRIAKWNGTSWSSLGSGVNGAVNALAAIGRELYVGGIFTTAGGASANRIASWNGSSWSSLGSGVNGAVNALAALGTDLYVGGNFTTAGSKPSSYVARWKQGGSISGTLFYDLNRNCVRDAGEPGLAGWTVRLDPGSKFATTGSNGDYLFSSLGPATYTLSQDSNTYWQQTCPPAPGTHTVVLEDSGTVTAQDFANWRLGNVVPLTLADAEGSYTLYWGVSTGMHRCVNPADSVSGHQENFLPPPPPGFYAHFVQYRDGADPGCFGSGTMNDFRPYIDPAQRDTFKILAQNGVPILRLSWPTDLYDHFKQATLKYSDGAGGWVIVNMFAVSSVESQSSSCTYFIYTRGVPDTIATISGTMFDDLNGNCVRDTGEPGLAGWVMRLDPGPEFTSTNAGGNYLFGPLGPNTYTISQVSRVYWEQTCPPSPGTHTVAVTQTQNVTGQDFASQRISNVQNLAVSLGGGFTRPGFTAFYGLRFENKGSVTVDATLELSLPSQVSPNHFTWNLGLLPPGAIGYRQATVVIPSTVPLGTILRSSASITPIAGDINPGDNTAALSQTITGSFDPNDKSVFPVGSGASGAIGATDTLTYLIRFQNTGTDTAFNIVVRDSLDSDLDVSSVELGASSHPYTFGIVQPRELVFTFAGVNLPDSNVNEAGSNGFVQFKARPRPDVVPGADIMNTASIFFDFNPAVLTNTVHNKIWSAATAIQQGWNMISNPVGVTNDSVRVLYPTSISAYAYSFSTTSGYVQDYTMENGTGYWEKFPSALTQNLDGLVIARDTFNVVAGWNMIGTITSPVDTVTIVSIPPGLKASNWYGYGVTGYLPVTQLLPGRGYWVRSNGAGQFVLANPILAHPAKVQASGVNPADVLNSLTVTDNGGRSQRLFFGADAGKSIQPSMYDMPPLPPVDAFDARFSTAGGGSMVQTHGEESAEFTVAIQSDAYPVTVSWNVKDASYELTAGPGSMQTMRGEGTMKISNSEVNRLFLKLTGNGELPKEFALSQNYPNPFNPSTTIKYDLPKDSRVSLKLFNILGQEVATLVNEEQKAGYKSVEWSVGNFASGVYFYRIKAGDFVASKKLLVLK